MSIYLEDVSNISHSDAQQVLKDIRKSNVNKLVFETKLDDSFPEGQFSIDGSHTPFRYDRNGNGGGILLHVLEHTSKNHPL